MEIPRLLVTALVMGRYSNPTQDGMYRNWGHLVKGILGKAFVKEKKHTQEEEQPWTRLCGAGGQ